MRKFIVVWAALIAGCGVSNEQIQKATELCAPHNGIGWLYGSAGGNGFIVRCKNKVQIESTVIP